MTGHMREFLALLQMLADIRPNEEHAKEHIERNPVTTVAQVVPEMSEHEVIISELGLESKYCKAQLNWTHMFAYLPASATSAT